MSVLSALSISRKPARAFAALGAFWGCFSASLPMVKADLAIGDAYFGALLLGTSLGLLAAMWLAPLLERLAGRQSLPLSGLVFGACMILPALAPVPLVFFLAMVMVGLGSGLLDILMNARVSDLEAQSGRSLMNANHGMFSLAYAISAVLTGLAREGGATPLMLFPIAAVVCVAATARLRLAPAAGGDVARAVRGVSITAVLLCGAIVLAAFLTEAAVEAWAALHIERNLEGGAAAGALGPAMLGLTMAVGRFGGQALTDRMGEGRLVLWAGSLAALGCLGAGAAPTPVLAQLSFGLIGLGVSVIGPVGLAMVGRRVPAEERTDAISKTAVLGFSGFFIAPVVMGGVSELVGLNVAFALLALIMIALWPLVAKVRHLPKLV